MPRFLPLLCVLCAMTSCAKQPAAVIDDLFADYASADSPGAAVLVIRDGEKILTATYGVADVSTAEPVNAATNFRLASITKQFTATAIMMLIEDGKLSLDTKLAELYQSVNPYAASITIEQILRHQSGLPDYELMMPDDATDQAHDADVLQMMLTAEEGYFQPGTGYRYSNSGYAVLAMIVQQLSQQSFAEFLNERIFTPTGMRSTVAYQDGVSTVPNRAFGYVVSDAGVEAADQSLYSAVLGDGGIYSSLNDLYQWDQSLYRDDLISPESKAAMLTPSLEDYGYGWRIDKYKGHARHHHSGSTSGFRNFIQRFPDKKLTVIVLSNRAEPDVKPLAEAVGDLYL